MTSSPYTMNGTMVTTFLATLNAGAGFAGHTDWRIPNLNELESIVNYQKPYPPAVDAAFNTGCAASCTGATCSCTASDDYWSSTTYHTFRLRVGRGLRRRLRAQRRQEQRHLRTCRARRLMIDHLVRQAKTG